MKHRLLAACLALAGFAAAPARAAGPAPADVSEYVRMPDGTRLAVSFWLPSGAGRAKPAPTILVQTRYGRAREGRDPEYAHFRANGFVVAIVDVRGTTASFGDRMAEIGSQERADTARIVADLAARPWSDGHVIAHGVSYMADTADFATASPVPALIGAIPRETDFDVYSALFAPGGVANAWFGGLWAEVTLGLDYGVKPPLDCGARQADCLRLAPRLTPVSADPAGALLHQAVRRRHWQPGDVDGVTFRTERSRAGVSFWDSSPASALAEIRRLRRPVQYWGSWMDGGTAASALWRYAAAPDVPAEIWLTANDHEHLQNADPFFPDRKAPLPSVAAQHAATLDFARGLVAGHLPARVIHYLPLGTTTFRQTTSWPPPGITERTLALGPGTLAGTPPTHAATGTYAVDFTASTGEASRWTTQGGVPPAYGDRRAADRKLAVFDSAPLPDDTLLAGWPWVSLTLTAHSTDPAVFAYLEDVAPDGRVTYLTEGMLRALHRKIANPASLPYDPGPAPHSFAAADALTVTPGARMDVPFAFFPVAALIHRGHRLRLAIGGADAAIFTRHPAQGAETFRFQFGGDRPSLLHLPLGPATP